MMLDFEVKTFPLGCLGTSQRKQSHFVQNGVLKPHSVMSCTNKKDSCRFAIVVRQQYLSLVFHHSLLGLDCQSAMDQIYIIVHESESDLNTHFMYFWRLSLLSLDPIFSACSESSSSFITTLYFNAPFASFMLQWAKHYAWQIFMFYAN